MMRKKNRERIEKEQLEQYWMRMEGKKKEAKNFQYISPLYLYYFISYKLFFLLFFRCFALLFALRKKALYFFLIIFNSCAIPFAFRPKMKVNRRIKINPEKYDKHWAIQIQSKVDGKFPNKNNSSTIYDPKSLNILFGDFFFLISTMKMNSNNRKKKEKKKEMWKMWKHNNRIF